MDYKKKYLKYKTKYFELKKIQNGGDPLEDRTIGEKILFHNNVPYETIDIIKGQNTNLIIDKKLAEFILFNINKDINPAYISSLVLLDETQRQTFKSLLENNIDFIYAEKFTKAGYKLDDIKYYVNMGLPVNFIESALKFSPEQKEQISLLSNTLLPSLAYHIVNNKKTSEQIEEIKTLVNNKKN
jgi:hypothetical protein